MEKDGEASRVGDEEFQGSNWELFILALSLLSLANVALYFLSLSEDSMNIVAVVDFALCAFFLADFAHRLLAASSKRGYVLRGGGRLDLIGSISLPGFRVARLFRVARVPHAIRLYGVGRLVEGFRASLANAAIAILVVLFLVLVVLESASSTPSRGTPRRTSSRGRTRSGGGSSRSPLSVTATASP